MKAPDGDVIRLTVSDNQLILNNTCDIPDSLTAEELTTPFVKADKSRSGNKGIGIGLSIVMTLAKQQNISCYCAIEDGFFRVSIS